MRGQGHLGHSAVSHPGFSCWSLQKSQETMRAHASLAWFHHPLSSPRYSGLPNPSPPCPSIRTHTYFPSPTETTKVHPRGSSCTLPGKPHTPPTQTRPQAPACLYPRVVWMDVERHLELERLSSAGRGEGGRLWESGDGRRSELTALDIIRWAPIQVSAGLTQLILWFWNGTVHSGCCWLWILAKVGLRFPGSIRNPSCYPRAGGFLEDLLPKHAQFTPHPQFWSWSVLSLHRLWAGSLVPHTWLGHCDSE